jgi:anti-sigma factor (TIGR02949 family)
MNIIPIGPKHCERIRKYLDSYINNELLVETNHEVLKHLESCVECADALKVRQQIQNRLREAVRREMAPADLRERIRKRIRQETAGVKLTTPWTRWALAAAAVLTLFLGGWGTLQLWRLHYGNNLSSQAGLPDFISEQTRSLLRIGVSDHVHCVIEHHDDREWNTPKQMATEVGPDYFGLVALVNAKLPRDYKVSVAHRCEVNGRRFVHLIFKNQENVLSLVITPKGGQGFPVQDSIPGLNSSGVVLHQAHLQGFEVVGFETREYLAYVVSALGQQENLQIAVNLAPPVNNFLTDLEL